MDFFKSKKNTQDSASSSYGDYNYDYYGGEGGQEAAKAEPEFAAEKRRPAAAPAAGAAYSMKLMKPADYKDGPVIAEELMHGNAVIINLENASAEVASNLIFFLDGVTYAIRGHLKAVSATTFMLTPDTMDIIEADTESREETSEDSGYGYTGYGSDAN